MRLDEILGLQQERNPIDATKQLTLKIDITSKKGFAAYLSGGDKTKRATGLLPAWVRKLIQVS